MKNYLTNKPTNAVKPLLSSRGFALIATISILSLIALISLALLSLATTKTKVSSYSNHLNIARDNARLALEIAIGQLQKYTGPDQRVTARADITDRDWTDVTPQVANPYYHLAWDVSGSEIDYTVSKIGYNTNHNLGYQRVPGNRGWGSFGAGGGVFKWDDFRRDGSNKEVDNSYLHRPGMKPGHNFDKKPAVLVSGNEFYDLIKKDTSGNLTNEYIVGDYPSSNYVDQYTDLEADGIARVEIIPSSSIMIPGSLDTGATNDLIKVEVPIVKVAGSTEGSSYAYWIGDESLKSRINLKSDLGEAASQVSQRAPLLESFQKKVADGEITADDINKRLTMPSLELNAATTEKKGFSYSPDVTTSSESLVVDVRNGGFKKDFTFSLYNPERVSPLGLRDNSIILDMPEIDGKDEFGREIAGQENPWTQQWSPGAGLLPIVEKWRNLAEKPVREGAEITTFGDDRGIYPVMSQVQMGQHLAYQLEDSGNSFRVYLGIFPSATLWNPYNVPLRINHDVSLGLTRRSLSLEGSKNKLTTDYELQSDDGTFSKVENVEWPPAQTGWLKDANGNLILDEKGDQIPVFLSDDRWSGWTLAMTLKASDANPVIIPPGETMVFSPSQNIVDDVPMNKFYQKTIRVDLVPGWNTGQGVLSRMDDKKHLVEDYKGASILPPLGGVLTTPLPKARIIQKRVSDSLLWSLQGHGRAGSQYLFGNDIRFRQPRVGFPPNPVRWSWWSRLDAVAQSASAFFSVPKVPESGELDTARLDTSGAFPALLAKHALRMGDDYLQTPDSAIQADQTELTYPYVANFNPAAISHAGYGDSSNSGVAGEAVSFAPSLMGGVFDFQSSNEIYPVGTKFAPERETATPIGIGYLNGGKLILMNRPFESTLPNGASASITSFSQLNNSQLLKGARQHYSAGNAHIFGYMSSSNIPAFPIGNSLGNPKLDLHHDDVRSSGDIPRYRDPASFTESAFLSGIGKVLYSPRGKRQVSSMELDFSYLLNEHLYDHYFFSTIPQDPGDYDGSLPLVNSRLVPSEEAKQDYLDDSLTSVPETGATRHRRVGLPVPLTDAERERYTNKLKNFDSAEYLALVGGFNVNSTSVAAWEMLLSSSLGTERGSGVSGVSFSNKEAKGSAKAAGEVTEDEAIDSDFHMTLTQSQIRELAEAMVSEVKRRGPFPSLSAFVNRANFLEDMARPNPNQIRTQQDEDRDDEEGTVKLDFDGKKPTGMSEKERLQSGLTDSRYSGAIQSALDRIGANRELDELSQLDGGVTGWKKLPRVIDQSGFAEKTADGSILPAREALRKSVNSHLPGYLKQSDVLSQIAPVVTVRGDTFTIRCFGASGEGPDGQPIAKAVCEAVVQRGKEFVDSTDEPGAAVRTVVARTAGTTSTLSKMNQVFGRKYKIVSFKWLSQAEVKKMEISDL